MNIAIKSKTTPFHERTIKDFFAGLDVVSEGREYTCPNGYVCSIKKSKKTISVFILNKPKVHKVLKAYKYKLIPTEEQKQFLDTCMAANRFVWNAMLETYNTYYQCQVNKYGNIRDEKGKRIVKPMSLAQLGRESTELRNTEGYEWLKTPPARAYSFLLKVFEASWKNYFRKLKDGTIAKEKSKYIEHRRTTGKRFSLHRLRTWGHPRFKSPLDKQSFQTDRTYEIDFGSKIFKLKKESIKFRVSDTDKVFAFLENAVRKTVTVSKSKVGLYYVSILFEIEADEVKKPEIKEVLGVDLRVRTSAVTSDGMVFPNPQPLKKHEVQLKKLQKKASRQYRQNGGKTENWKKTQQKIKKLHAKIANIRCYNTHQLTHAITSTHHDTVVIENLDVKSMMAKPMPEKDSIGFKKTGKQVKKILNRNMADANLSETLRQIKYKAGWRGKNIIVADRHYASSQICSSCGNKNPLVQEKRLQEWECPSCGTKHNTAKNAAQNLKDYAKKA